jgi:AcrR family transcriptional regulator
VIGLARRADQWRGGSLCWTLRPIAWISGNLKGRVSADGDNSNNPSYDIILEAARALFVEKGFQDTSMGAIARRAEVVRATVYNNFRDKDAILAMIVQRYQQGYAAIPERLRGRLEAGESSFELIEATIREAFEWRMANAKIRPLLDLAKALPNNAAWNEANRAADDAMQRWIRSIFRRDEKRGVLHEGLNTQFAAAALYRMIDAALASSDVNASRATVRSTVRQLALLLWHAAYQVEPDRPAVESPKASATGV